MTDTRQPEPLYRAKRPKTVLAGPYGHPFHPVLVTIPIGVWIASAVSTSSRWPAPRRRRRSLRAPTG